MAITIGKISKKYVAVTMLKIAAACFLGAFSFYKLTVQAKLIPGGFSGIGAVIELLARRNNFGANILTAGVIGIFMNIPLYIISYKGMNKRFFWFSVYGMVMWSVMLEVVGRTMPEGVLDIQFDNPTLAPLLYAVVSGVASGISGGYIIRLGYSTGGSEMLSALINKRFPFIKMGTIINAIKIFVISLYAVCLGTTAEMIVLTLLAGFITSAVIDMLVDGFRAAKAYYIISNHPTEMAAAILGGLNRSSTLFSGEGARLHTEQKMLMCIVYNHEVAKLRAIVHSVDNHAFMFSTMVKEAYGTGFAEQKPPVKLFRTITRNPKTLEPKTNGEPFTISGEAKNIAREIKLRSTACPDQKCALNVNDDAPQIEIDDEPTLPFDPDEQNT